MNLPTTTPNDRDLAWYVRECEALQCINAALKKQANDEFDAVITRNMELERENAALREILINADELERYSGSDGRREWGKCSTWLHADDAVIIVSAKALDAIRKEI